MLFAILAAGFETCRGTIVERIAVRDMILVPTGAVLNLLAPAHPVRLMGRTLVSQGASLTVTRGCEGIELMMLLMAAVGASAAPLPDKLRGLLLGCLLAYGLSIARLAILDVTLRDAPGTWQAMHGLIMPLAPVVLLSLYFLHWSAACMRAVEFRVPAT